MNFDIIVLCSGVIGAMFILIPVKELKNEYYVFALAALSVVVFIFALRQSKPIFDYMKNLLSSEGSFYLKILFKILGISIITNLISELAQDLGMNGISGKIEFAGKIGILLSAMPVYDKLFFLIGTIL